MLSWFLMIKQDEILSFLLYEITKITEFAKDGEKVCSREKYMTVYSIGKRLQGVKQRY